MDEIVKAALRKWPQVPHCHGWLALDARGDWYMRDEQTQAAGPFPLIKGNRILHDKLREFIGRNYAHDEHGGWYFQNGPQRVYVELEAAPWVWRLGPNEEVDRVTSHTGVPATVMSSWLDELGRLFLATDLGFGLVHTLDMELASRRVETGAWQPRDSTLAALVARFRFQLKPAPPA